MQKVITIELYSERIQKDPGYIVRTHPALDELLAQEYDLNLVSYKKQRCERFLSLP